MRIQRYFLNAAVGSLQQHIAGTFRSQAGIEVKTERQNRDTAGALVFALTVKFGKKSLPYPEMEYLIFCGGHTRGGFDPLAPDQIHFGPFGKTLPALQQQQPVGISFFQQPGMGLYNGLPLRVSDDLCIHPLPDTVDGKPHIGKHRGFPDRCIKGQDKHLILGNFIVTVIRGGKHHGRAAR